MKIAIGSDHGDAFYMKSAVTQFLSERGHDVIDVGCYDESAVDYPPIAQRVAKYVASGECERGILICSTGIGMSIAANKVRGIRCALCHDVFSAKMTRLHNDSNMLAMGARVIGKGLAVEIVGQWLSAEFEGGRHARRVGQITAIESDNFAADKGGA